MVNKFLAYLFIAWFSLFCGTAFASRLHEAKITDIINPISEANSTNAPLAAAGTFTGASEEIKNYAIVFVNVATDQAGTLALEQSADGVNWDHSDTYAIDAGAAKNFSINPFAQYYRTTYTNGASPQTYLRLQTIYKNVYSKPSSHAINEAIDEVDDAELTKSVLSAQIADDGFVNIGATESGNLKTTDAENGLAIAKGEVVGTSFVHKFGNAPDFDTGDLEVTVWDGAEDGTAWELMEYVYSTTADIDSISSSNAADNQAIRVFGLDANYIEVSQTVTLNGQTRVALGTDLIRVYRAFNTNGTDLAGHVFVYVNGTTTGGVPDTNADIRAIIDPVNQQTEMAVYTVPAGKTGYMRDWYASTAGANRNSNYPVKLISRELGGIFRVKHTSAISDVGTSSYKHNYQEPEVFPEKTDIEIKMQVSATGVTGATVSAGFDIVLVDE